MNNNSREFLEGNSIMLSDNQLYEQNNKLFGKTKLFIIALFLVADSRFFYLLPLPDIFGGVASNKTFIGLVSLICFIWMALVTKKINVGKYANLILFLYVFLFCQAFFEKYRFQYSTSSILFNLIPFLLFLMYFTINTFLDDKKSFKLFCLLCEWTTIFLSICLLLQLLVYNKMHFLFLNFTLSDWYTKYHVTASGRFAGVSEGYIRIAVLISFFNILNGSRKGKGIAISSFLLAISDIIFVDQSRVYIIQTVISLFFMYLIAKKNKINVNVILTIIIFAMLATVILIPKFNSIIDTLNNSSDGSNYARIGAIYYYLSFIGNYLFTGLGEYIPDEGTSQYYFIKGGQGIYNFDDIGIFGVLASMGILILIWYLLVIIKNFRLSFLIKDRNEKALAFGLSIMMLTGIFTASYLDRERLISLVLTMTIINFCARESNLNIHHG